MGKFGRTLLIVICIAVLLVFLAFQAGIAMIGLAISISKFIAVAAGIILLVAFLRRRYKNRA